MSTYHFRADPVSTADNGVVFLFHGTGGDENQFFDFAGQLLPGVRRIAPRGDVSEHGALRYFRRKAEGVYDMDDLKVRTDAMRDFVREKMAESQAGWVLGLGYSNGANILASLMFSDTELFDTVVLMHPLIPFAPPENRYDGTRVLITAGRGDPIAPAPATQALADYFASSGAEVSLVWHGGGHEIRQEEIAAIGQFLKDA